MSVINAVKNLKGAKVGHFKNTSEQQTIAFPIPQTVKISMSQHIGAPCTPIVKKGDLVAVGQRIGQSEQFVSSIIHASCSGTVSGIEDYQNPNGSFSKVVVIQTDGLQTPAETIAPPSIHSKEDLIEAVKNSGLVGLGGAGFPAFVKLAYKDIDRVTKLVINAAECEPFITADYRECMENTQDILNGIQVVSQYLDIPDVYIGIEDNKPDAIAKLDAMTNSDSHIHVVKLPSLYPQGAEKSIIYATTRIVVEEGKLPADCGVIVMNVSSIGFIGTYLRTGMPLIAKRITVDGDAVKKPQNLLVPLGTAIEDILSFCSVEPTYSKILMGGPMMGLTLASTNAYLLKNNNAITVLTDRFNKQPAQTPCIHCSRCINTCPMHLMPTRLERAYDAKDVQELLDYKIGLCINCGCCSFVCPAKRQLAQKNQLAKLLVKNQTKK